MTAHAADESGLSIQEQLTPQGSCFGCGPANRSGLQLRSYVRDGLVVAAFIPRPEHGNGVGLLNGGIISTLLDCHSAAVVLMEASRQGWRPASGVEAPFLTADLHVRFLRPTPLHEALCLQAKAIDGAESTVAVDVGLIARDRLCATAIVFWKRRRAGGPDLTGTAYSERPTP